MRRFPALFAIPILFALACSDAGDPVSPGDGDDNPGNGGGDDSTAVSFADDVLPIFTASCAVSGCHSAGSRAGNMSLAATDAYGSIVGVTSVGYAPVLRVAAGDPDASVLYQKVLGNQTFGVRMPFGAPALSDEEIATIRAWIEAGALDD